MRPSPAVSSTQRRDCRAKSVDYHATMISRHHWIAAFIGRVLRQGHASDPDRVYDAADELYLGMCELDPEFAADSAFGPLGRSAGLAGTPRSGPRGN